MEVDMVSRCTRNWPDTGGEGGLLSTITLFLDYWGFKMFLHPFAGLTSVVVYLVLIRFRHRDFRFSKALCRGVIILQLYYSDYIGFGALPLEPFWRSCIASWVMVLVLPPLLRTHSKTEPERYLPYLSGSSRSLGDVERPFLSDGEDESTPPREPTTVQTDLGPVGLHKFFVHSVYMDVTGSGLDRCLLCFIGQMALFNYYIFEMSAEDPDRDSVGELTRNCSNVGLVKWFCAIAIGEIAVEDELVDFKWTFWPLVIATWQKHKFKDEPWLNHGLAKPYIFLRAFLSFTTNAVARAALLGTGPILLSVEEPLEYIKDAAAIFFIIQLDGLSSDRAHYMFDAKEKACSGRSCLNLRQEMISHYGLGFSCKLLNIPHRHEDLPCEQFSGLIHTVSTDDPSPEAREGGPVTLLADTVAEVERPQTWHCCRRRGRH